ncbi:MAG: LamG domain-containing protein [Gallionella sp.]
MNDYMISGCYSITCAQAGGTFYFPRTLAINKAMIDGYAPIITLPSLDIVGGVVTSLKEGETIADIQNGIAQSLDNAPYLTVAGFKPDLYCLGSVAPKGFYSLGDGLISLMGQAALPSDFSDQAFDSQPSTTFKFKFESAPYPTVRGHSLTLTTLPKGDCLKYSVASREYLICGFSAHTSSKTPRTQYCVIPSSGSTSSYAVANYDGSSGSIHVIPSLVNNVNYLAITPEPYLAAPQAPLASTVKGRLAASGAPQQVALVGSPALTPITSALIWATIVEKTTGVTKGYFNAVQSDSNGNFNIDVGSFITDKFGANAVLSNYSVKLKIDTVGRYKSWFKTIDTLSAAVDLGDIDLSQVTSNVAVISPAFATLNTPTTLTVTGTNLPLTAVLSMADAVCQTPTNRAASGFTVSCTPQGTATGVKVITVKTDKLANGGAVIDAKWTVTVSATQPAIPTNGLVAYYPFDNDVHDASGNFNNGLPGGSVAFVSGIVGNGAKFNGIRSAGGGQAPDHVLVPNSTSLQFTNAMTISYWVRIDGNQSQTNADCSGAAVTSIFGTVVAKSGDRNGFVLNEFDTGSSLQINPWSGGLGLNNGNTVLSSVYGTFRHVAYVVNGNTASQYINGVLVSSATGLVDFIQPNTRDLYIGASFNRGGACLDFWGQLDGVVDELRIYNRALSTQEIQGVFTFR